LACVVLAISLVLFWRFIGLPADPLTAFLWLWAATVAWNISAPAREHLAFPRDWWPMVALLLVYGYSRGIADNLGTSVHVTTPIRFDEWLGGGTLPTAWMQQHLCGTPCTSAAPAHWYDLIASTIYFSHFVVPLGLAAVLWVRDRGDWAAYMRRLIVLDAVGLVIYVVYPMAPPWWASEHGYYDGRTLGRITHNGWEVLGLSTARNWLVDADELSNPVAAMPSMHLATALLVATVVIRLLDSPWRWLMLAYPVVMAATLVYCAEHYVMDLLAGLALAALVMAAVRRAESWWEHRLGDTPRSRHIAGVCASRRRS
jgi:PAP2 superfamily